jgi:hypothetical protein
MRKVEELDYSNHSNPDEKSVWEHPLQANTRFSSHRPGLLPVLLTNETPSCFLPPSVAILPMEDRLGTSSALFGRKTEMNRMAYRQLPEVHLC